MLSDEGLSAVARDGLVLKPKIIKGPQSNIASRAKIMNKVVPPRDR